MRRWIVPVRITRTARCPEGFFLLVNNSRLRFPTKKAALAAIDSVLSLQKIQVVSVREYADRRKHRQKIVWPTQKI